MTCLCAQVASWQCCVVVSSQLSSSSPPLLSGLMFAFVLVSSPPDSQLWSWPGARKGQGWPANCLKAISLVSLRQLCGLSVAILPSLHLFSLLCRLCVYPGGDVCQGGLAAGGGGGSALLWSLCFDRRLSESWGLESTERHCLGDISAQPSVTQQPPSSSVTSICPLCSISLCGQNKTPTRG